ASAGAAIAGDKLRTQPMKRAISDCGPAETIPPHFELHYVGHNESHERDHLVIARFPRSSRQVLWFASSINRGSGMKPLAAALPALLSVLVAPSAIAQQGINAQPDAIFYNGTIITVDSAFTIAQAFAVRGDQYVA